ncbi:hypothetical protein [Streptomyces sp. WAC01526]|uniref:hypothetical protein n=1 Tax=Streptomyces sp. WAC01526 TaxID=2588709 RepID=UPI0016527E67|nr:hypothetical protein [Streptomyces sp. WAC01526]
MQHVFSSSPRKLPNDFQGWVLLARYWIMEDIGNDEIEDLSVALLESVKMKRVMERVLPLEVARARADHVTWNVISDALGKDLQAVWKKFRSASVPPEFPNAENGDRVAGIRESRALSAAIDSVLRDLVVQAKCDRWGWGDPGTREKGMPWREIAFLFERGLSAIHERYGRGLTLERVQQLDEELEWASGLATDQVDREWIQSLLSARNEMRRVP